MREYLAKLQSISGKKLTNRSRDNARRLIISLFNFARQQGYVSRELAEEIAELPRPKLEPVKTGVFVPSAMRTLLEGADDELRCAIAIGGFAGLRTAELHRLDWKDVHLAERVIIVGADKAKTASRRVVPMAENLAGWLSLEVRGTGPIVHRSHEHQLAWDFCKLARRAGIDWVKNGLRHSFGSYRLAVTGNAPQTAYEAGNSVEFASGNDSETSVSFYQRLRWIAKYPEWMAGRLDMIVPGVNANSPEANQATPDLTFDTRSRQRSRVIALPDGAEILNKTGLARRLGVTERHIENLIKTRQIPHMRLGTKALRFIWADVVRSLSVPNRT